MIVNLTILQLDVEFLRNLDTEARSAETEQHLTRFQFTGKTVQAVMILFIYQSAFLLSSRFWHPHPRVSLVEVSRNHVQRQHRETFGAYFRKAAVDGTWLTTCSIFHFECRSGPISLQSEVRVLRDSGNSRSPSGVPEAYR